MNFGFSLSAYQWIAAALALLLCGVSPAVAQDVEVSAALTAASTEVGQPVQYQITVAGARGAKLPRQIHVDGLDISYAGESTQVQMNNFNIAMHVIYAYTVTPQRKGRFVIPAQAVEAGGQKYMANSV